MELSSFSRKIVTVPYERNGEQVELSVNIDAFTPEFFRKVGERFKSQLGALETEEKAKRKARGGNATAKVEFFEVEARSLEINRDIYAELLSNGVLVGWNVTRDSEPLEPSREILSELSPSLVKELWEACLDAAKTVKKTVDAETIPGPTTSEITETGSREFTIPLNAPIM